MRTAPRLLAVAGVLALLVAACGDDDDSSDQASTGGRDETTTSTAPEDAASSGTEVRVADTDLGQVVVDAEGKTLYVFDNDEGGRSACEGGCASTWPPLATDGDPKAGDGVDAGLLGTTDRSDGTKQVTYDGQPLYTYAADSAAGDTNGQGVGGIWWVVAPNGEPVREAAGGGSTTTTVGATGDPGY